MSFFLQDYLTSLIISSPPIYLQVFFVIHLHAGPVINTLPPIVDPDPLLSCDLMDGRDAFLTLARDKHWEFSSLRRSKWSTLCMLVELHTQGQDRFVYTCNECKHHVETRWHCTVCEVGVYHQRLLLSLALQLSLIFYFFFNLYCPKFFQIKPIVIKGLLSLKGRKDHSGVPLLEQVPSVSRHGKRRCSGMATAASFVPLRFLCVDKF